MCVLRFLDSNWVRVVVAAGEWWLLVTMKLIVVCFVPSLVLSYSEF